MSAKDAARRNVVGPFPFLLGVAVALTSTTGCGDPSLKVTFRVPAPYRNDLESVVLRVYQPPVGQPFGCLDLAFQDVAEDVLRASLVREVALRPGIAAPLGELDRNARKVLVADAFFGGLRGVTGCAELSKVESDTVIEIEGEPRSRLAVTDGRGLSVPPGTSLNTPLRLALTDFRDSPLSSVEVRWHAVSATDAIRGRAESNALGEVFIMPELPQVLGPLVLDVRSRWSDDIIRVPGFLAPSAMPVAITGAVRSYRKGRIGPQGRQGLAALISDSPGTSRVVLVYGDGAGGFVQASTPQIQGANVQLGLIENTQKAADQVMLVTEREWFEVQLSGSLIPRPYSPPTVSPNTSAIPVGIFMASNCSDDGGFSPCTESDGPRVFISYDTGLVGEFSSEGRRCDAFFLEADLLQSGCVSDDKGLLARTLLVTAPEFGLALVSELEDNTFFPDVVVALRFGFDFSPSIGGSERMLLATQLNVNDFVVSRLTIERSRDQIRVTTRGLDSPPLVPRFTQGGDVDADGRLDVVALLDSSESSPHSNALWSVLGREHLGQRIQGDVDVGAGQLRAPQLLVLDFDGDGQDEIVLAERPARTPNFDPGTVSNLALYRLSRSAGSALVKQPVRDR